MSYLTQMRVRNNHGALERILGVVRVRGFGVRSMSALPDAAGSHFDLTLKVVSPRPPHRLSRQLAKLVDVENVEIFGRLEQAGTGLG